MTQEEAIVQIYGLKKYCEAMADSDESGSYVFDLDVQALDLALSSLRPVSWEQVERAWMGCSWCNNEGKNPENWECSLLDDRGFSVVVGDEVVWTNAEFCPVCGKPLTDEAVDIVLRRLEALKDGKDD